MERTVENVRPGTSRTVLYTPHITRTRERQRFSLGLNNDPVEEDSGGNVLEVLLKQTWTIYGVSALFGFQHDELHFKQYAKRLREEVASTLTKEDVAYDAKFSFLINDSASSDTGDPPAIKVEVYASTNGGEKEVEKCIYKGIFMSWKTPKNESNVGNCIKLPLLLCRGTRSCTEAVHSTLSKMFDCMVIALPAKEDDLMWLVPIIIAPSSKEDRPKSAEEIRLVYTVPGLPVTDTITTKFKVLDLVKVLEIINEDQNQDAETIVYMEHIEKFYEVLYTQMLEIASLQLGLCTLHRIDLPSITIMENKMKVMNIETMDRVLSYLNEKALDTLHTLQFDV